MINWEKVKSQAVAYLNEFIQINTSNPPGNELEAIRWLETKAKQHGLVTSIQETAVNRGNIMISIKEEFHQPLILLSHVDVVPALDKDWEVPPFSGQILNGEIWGRGTIDTKQLTITHLIVLILIKEYGLPLKNDVVMIATSDEENGSQYGLLPFLDQHGSIFKGSTVFNEGGGFPLHIKDRFYYLCEMGQKGRAIIKIASSQQKQDNPYLPNNSAIKIITEAINRIHSIPLDEVIPPITQILFQTIANDLRIPFHQTTRESFFASIPTQLRPLFQAMSKTTFSITKWEGGRKHPSLQGSSEMYIDCRTLPSVTETTLKEYLHTILGDLQVQYEILEFSQGYEIEVRRDDLSLFEKVLQKDIPNAQVVPFLSIGGSDSRHLKHYQSQVYGYCPVLPDLTFDKVIKMVHGINERIPIHSLLFGIQNMVEIITTMERSNHYEFY
ncbi:M20/M25/M40 family metallo-hydrolase [Pseudoneobacillus sp. C159]